MTAQAVHTDAMEKTRTRLVLIQFQKSHFPVWAQVFLCFYSASYFTKLIFCVLIWSLQQCIKLSAYTMFVFIFFSANALCQIITLQYTHFPHKHQMAPAQASSICLCYNKSI